MRKRTSPKILDIDVKVEKLNERGYGVGKSGNYEVQVLNALPGEEIKAKVFKKRRSILYAQSDEILKKSPARIKPKEAHFLSCSPWQIIDLNNENQIKKDIISELFASIAQTEVPDFKIASNDTDYAYRNKVEFSFFGHNEDGHLSLAFHMRESGYHKQPIEGCELLPEPVNKAAQRIVDILNEEKIEARQLKGLLLRYSFTNNTVLACLYVKDTSVEQIFSNPDKMKKIKALVEKGYIQGFFIISSDTRSPAFVETDILHQYGQGYLEEEVLDLKFQYAYNGFFQINPPMFCFAIKDIRKYLEDLPHANTMNASDLYAGVGTIGLSIANLVKEVTGIEITPNTKHFALLNAENNNINNFKFFEGAAEKDGLQFVDTDILILDPPRSGLHPKVTEKIIESKPKHIIYLSCNPKTQAEDFVKIKDLYDIKFFKGYNFYPHTPHVENLMILELKIS